MKMPAPTMPPMTSMVASNRPSRRARGCDEAGSVCGTELKYLPAWDIKRDAQEKDRKTGIDGHSNGNYAATFFFFRIPAMRASRRWPRHPERNETAIIALVWRSPEWK